MEKQLFELLLRRLINFSTVPERETKFFYADTEGTLHERLILNGLLTKPSWEEFEAEESKYNNELYMAAEKARLEQEARDVEEARVADWTNRLKMPHFRTTMTSLDNHESNPAMVVREIINNKDESVLIQYEEAHAIIETAYNLESNIELLYTNMVKDVYDSMELAFGTRNDMSVSASVATYEAMIKRPNKYIDVELGLADKASVEAYATAKLEAADTYAILRMKRIAKFQVDKDLLVNA